MNAAVITASRADSRFMLAHPSHLLAFGFGAGLSPWAPGTAGTLLAWLAFHVLDRWLGPIGWATLLLIAFVAGWWACVRTARDLGVADPAPIVWDEVVAFWFVLWIVTPAPWWLQFVAFVLFRVFDAVKPGPVRWADRRFHARADGAIGAREGFGILFDDLVAALLTLVVLAIAVAVARVS